MNCCCSADAFTGFCVHLGLWAALWNKCEAKILTRASGSAAQKKGKAGMMLSCYLESRLRFNVSSSSAKSSSSSLWSLLRPRAQGALAAPISFCCTFLSFNFSAIEHLLGNGKQITFTTENQLHAGTERIPKNVSRLTPKKQEEGSTKNLRNDWCFCLFFSPFFPLVSFNMLISSDSSTAFLGDRLLNTLLEYT